MSAQASAAASEAPAAAPAAPASTSSPAPSKPALPPGAIAKANAGLSLPTATAGTSSKPAANGTASKPNGSASGGEKGGKASSPGVNQNGKRELSPERSGGQPPAKTSKSSHGDDAKGSKAAALLPMGRGQGIDLRAEEEAARKVARSQVGGAKFAGSGSRAKQTDLFGDKALRARLNRIAQEHGMVVDDEAMHYLAMAAEVRVRTMLASAVRAQQHRVHSTHHHKPPMLPASGNRPARALWSQKITSDTNAVMTALMTANREENKAHRVARTERNARETELARAAAAAKEREREHGGSGGGGTGGGGGGGGGGSGQDSGAASSPAGGQGSDGDDAPAAGPSRDKPRELVFQSAPTFGGPPPTTKKSKGKKGANRDVSAEVQAKITNNTAFLSVGRKRYAWETGGAGGYRPPVPSLLSGKRKKNDEEGEGGGDGEGGGGGEGKDEAGGSSGAAGAGAPPKPKKAKRSASAPHWRQIDVETHGDRRARDDRALTILDVLFALEHQGSGRGMGTVDEVVRKVWCRPGGPYGRW